VPPQNLAVLAPSLLLFAVPALTQQDATSTASTGVTATTVTLPRIVRFSSNVADPLDASVSHTVAINFFPVRQPKKWDRSAGFS
jgi:hypothetical protein